MIKGRLEKRGSTGSPRTEFTDLYDTVRTEPVEVQAFSRCPKVIEARYLGDFQVALRFVGGQEGVFDGKALLQRSGPLLEPLHKEPYFRRLFIDAGALCWPNGLEISPARVYELCKMAEVGG